MKTMEKAKYKSKKKQQWGGLQAWRRVDWGMEGLSPVLGFSPGPVSVLYISTSPRRPPPPPRLFFQGMLFLKNKTFPSASSSGHKIILKKVGDINSPVGLACLGKRCQPRWL